MEHELILHTAEQEVIIHNYSPDILFDNAKLLKAGRDLVSLASSQCKSGWHGVSSTSPFAYIQSPATASYVFAQKPPSTDTWVTRRLILKQWGEPTDSDDDIYLLADLDEFSSTDFGSLGEHSCGEKLPGVHVLDPRKTHIGALHSVIPQPHIHPSTLHLTPTSLPVQSFTKTSPIPIAPHKNPPPSPVPFARHAWLIPVRGMLPWDFATSAFVLDPSSSSPPEPPDPSTRNEITWTYASLTAFWSFLLKLRSAGDLGPIGLSFHASRFYETASSSSSLVNLTASQRNQDPTSLTSPPAVSTAAHTVRSPLWAVDHFKIYHDAVITMYLRTSLDSWDFPPLEPVGDDKTARIRLLEGAKLVLVDERSRGLLVS